MNPKTEFNERMLSKISAFLESKEGCNILGFTFTKEGARINIVDSLGFVYELDIKTTGRMVQEEV